MSDQSSDEANGPDQPTDEDLLNAIRMAVQEEESREAKPKPDAVPHRAAENAQAGAGGASPEPAEVVGGAGSGAGDDPAPMILGAPVPAGADGSTSLADQPAVQAEIARLVTDEIDRRWSEHLDAHIRAVTRRELVRLLKLRDAADD